MKIIEFFFKNYMGKMVGAEAGAGIFDKPEPEPHKNELAPQHCFFFSYGKILLSTKLRINFAKLFRFSGIFIMVLNRNWNFEFNFDTT
jgi:hypothetical protein